MRLIEWLRNAMHARQPAVAESRSQTLTAEQLMDELTATRRSRSGEPVSVQTSLTASPMWSGVSMISSDVGRLPMRVKRDIETEYGPGCIDAVDHPVWQLVRRNVGGTTTQGRMTPNIFIQRMVAHALLYGDAYARIYWTPRQQPERIEWLHSDKVYTDYVGGRVVYRVTYNQYEDGQSGQVYLGAEDILHLPGFTITQLGGMSIVGYARDTIGRILATSGYADDFFNNFGVPLGWLIHPSTMSPEAREKLQADLRKFVGAGNRHKIALLMEDIKWAPMGISPKDALLVDQFDFSVKDVARFLRIPPHKLGDDSKVAYNSIEAENRAYIDHTLGDWVCRLEAEMTDKLFRTDETDYRIDFDMSNLLRANTVDRWNAHRTAVEILAKTRNEIRREEGLNPVEGGDVFAHPLSFAQQDPSTQDNQDDTSTDQPPAEPNRSHDAGNQLLMRDLLSDQFARMATRLARSMAKSKQASAAWAWLNDAEIKHRHVIVDAIGPACRAAGIAADSAADAFLARSLDHLASLIDNTPPETLPSVINGATKKLQTIGRDVATELLMEGITDV